MTTIEQNWDFLNVGMKVFYCDMGNSVTATITEIDKDMIEVETADFYFSDNTKKEYLVRGELQSGWGIVKKSLEEINYTKSKIAFN